MTACMITSTETSRVSATPVLAVTTPFISKTKGTHANFISSMPCSIGHNDTPGSATSGTIGDQPSCLAKFHRAEITSTKPQMTVMFAIDDGGEQMIRMPE